MKIKNYSNTAIKSSILEKYKGNQIKKMLIDMRKGYYTGETKEKIIAEALLYIIKMVEK